MPKLAALMLYAAASLSDVLPEIAKEWTLKTQIPIEFKFDSSARLARQIIEGAKADVFIPADEEWLYELDKKSLLAQDTSKRAFAINRLVLVAKKALPLNGQSIEQVLKETPKLALAGENVPCGKFATLALKSMGLWATLSPKVVRGDHIRIVLNWVSDGSMPTAIVYETDAQALAQSLIQVGVIPTRHYPTIRYIGGVLRKSSAPKLAQDFLAFLQSGSAQGILAKAGFTPAKDAL